MTHKKTFFQMKVIAARQEIGVKIATEAIAKVAKVLMDLDQMVVLGSLERTIDPDCATVAAIGAAGCVTVIVKLYMSVKTVVNKFAVIAAKMIDALSAMISLINGKAEA